MFFALMPLMFALMWAGLVDIEQYQSAAMLPGKAGVAALSSGQLFLMYRNAVGSFEAANPTFTGVVSVTSLAPWLAPGSPIPPGFGAEITATPSGNGKIMYAWAQEAAGEALAIVRATGGDASVGTVSGVDWISPVYGVESTSVPSFVPNGSLLSIIQTGS